jgi:hypothetical protein
MAQKENKKNVPLTAANTIIPSKKSKAKALLLRQVNCWMLEGVLDKSDHPPGLIISGRNFYLVTYWGYYFRQEVKHIGIKKLRLPPMYYFLDKIENCAFYVL